MKCHPGPSQQVCKMEPQPDPGCIEVPQLPDKKCLDGVEDICRVGLVRNFENKIMLQNRFYEISQDMADELCRVEPVDICETEVTKQYVYSKLLLSQLFR